MQCARQKNFQERKEKHICYPVPILLIDTKTKLICFPSGLKKSQFILFRVTYVKLNVKYLSEEKKERHLVCQITFKVAVKVFLTSSSTLLDPFVLWKTQSTQRQQ